MEKEKEAFPDSVHYIDFLIETSKKKQQTTNTDNKTNNSDGNNSEQNVAEGNNEH